jgi:hypothetical protein
MVHTFGFPFPELMILSKKLSRQKLCISEGQKFALIFLFDPFGSFKRVIGDQRFEVNFDFFFV